MEITKEKLEEICACLRSSIKILKKAMYGVRFDGVFKNELSFPLFKSDKLLFELEKMIKDEK